MRLVFFSSSRLIPKRWTEQRENRFSRPSSGVGPEDVYWGDSWFSLVRILVLRFLEEERCYHRLLLVWDTSCSGIMGLKYQLSVVIFLCCFLLAQSGRNKGSSKVKSAPRTATQCYDDIDDPYVYFATKTGYYFNQNKNDDEIEHDG